MQSITLAMPWICNDRICWGYANIVMQIEWQRSWYDSSFDISAFPEEDVPAYCQLETQKNLVPQDK